MNPLPIAVQNSSFYSPTFHCYTTAAFYRGLLSELEKRSLILDKAKPASREAVWNQLFVLLGAKQVVCSKVFSPIIKLWRESPTINLLAIELLYIAISIIFDKSSLNLPFSGTPPNGAAYSHPSLLPITTTQSNEKKLTGGGSNQQQYGNHQRGVSLLPRASTPPGAANANHPPLPAPSKPTSTASPLGGNAPPMRLPVRQTLPPHQPIANAKEDQRRAPDDPKVEEGNNLLVKLIDLQKWKTHLDLLPPDKKQKLFDTLKIIDSSFPSDPSFVSLINTFAQSILDYKQFIECLHDLIKLFLKNGIISFDPPPPKPSLPSSSPSPSPPAISSPSRNNSIHFSRTPLPDHSPSNTAPNINININSHKNNNNNNPTPTTPTPTNNTSTPQTNNSNSSGSSNNNNNLTINQKSNYSLQPRLTLPTKGIIPLSVSVDDHKRKLAELGEVSNSPLKLHKGK